LVRIQEVEPNSKQKRGLKGPVFVFLVSQLSNVSTTYPQVA